MKNFLRVIVFLLFAALSASAQTKDVVAVVGGTIIDGNGGAPIEDGIIVIEGKRIVAVGGRTTPIPLQAKRIAAKGRFVIPGFVDGAVWLVQDYVPANTFIRYEGRFPEIAIEAAQMALKNGVTTVFDVWGPRDDLIKARDAINQGRTIGSRIYLAGNIIGYGGPYSEDFSLGGVKDLSLAISKPFTDRINAKFVHNVGPELTWMSPEQVRQEIRKYIHSGVDFLDVAATAHTFGAATYPMFSPRVLRAIIEEAHAADLPVIQTKLDNGEALAMQLDAGVDVLAGTYGSGLQPYSDEMVGSLARRQIPCMTFPYSKEGLDFMAASSTPSMAERLKVADVNIRSLIRAGAVIIMGTGASWLGDDTLKGNRLAWPNAPADLFSAVGEIHFNWLLNMQAMGMRPMAALMAATRNVAKAYKVDKDLGTLEAGRFADLIILDKNPLEDAKNYRSISLVIKEGSIVDREALPTVRVFTAQPGTPQ